MKILKFKKIKHFKFVNQYIFEKLKKNTRNFIHCLLNFKIQILKTKIICFSFPIPSLWITQNQVNQVHQVIFWARDSKFDRNKNTYYFVIRITEESDNPERIFGEDFGRHH